jgi:hypothetical protein
MRGGCKPCKTPIGGSIARAIKSGQKPSNCCFFQGRRMPPMVGVGLEGTRDPRGGQRLGLFL